MGSCTCTQSCCDLIVMRSQWNVGHNKLDVCFSGDNDDFIGDIVDTELELFTDIDKLSVLLPTWTCFCGFYDLKEVGQGLRGQ